MRNRKLGQKVSGDGGGEDKRICTKYTGYWKGMLKWDV